MWNFVYIAFAFGVLVQVKMSTAQIDSKNKVTLSLYYETLCPDCIAFNQNQLCPTWNRLSQFFTAEFIPYGNARTKVLPSGKTIIKCQHGKRECIGNVMNACALHHLASNRTTDFICCTEASSDPPKAGPKCASKLGVDFGPIQKCMTGPEGQKLHLAYGKQTDLLNPPHQYVPWILINGVHTESQQKECENDLMSVICKNIPDPKPRDCNALTHI